MMRIFRLSIILLAGCPALWAGGDARGNLRDAIDDLAASHGPAYPGAQGWLARLEALAPDDAAGLEALRREALLANPLLRADALAFVRRDPRRLGLPQNWQGNCSLPRHGYDNAIMLLAPFPGGAPRELFRPPEGAFAGDTELHWDGKRMLFSMPGPRPQGGRWHVWEIPLAGGAPRQLTPDEPDVDQYDACYLPDGRVVFASTAGFQGVPCVGGGDNVANLFLLDPATRHLRQLCYDQDHNWNPAVLNDGRVLYTRWEYTDTAHYFTRLLFTMNPDGTSQMALYGSNSYWPNSVFGARAVPGHPSLVAGIVSGHHGVPRMGELVLFDPALGRRSAAGAVRRIPGRGKPVEPVVADQLVQKVWPRFLHPFPLSEKYFLVSCQPAPDAPWGIWLADIFDNLVPVHVEPGMALLEPALARPAAPPPVIPDRVNLEESDATVFLEDVYAGPGLAGVARGAVKRLRVFEYHYAYRRMGGHLHIGIDGPWDARRILGTVPVQADGSAHFRIPANTPVAVQPLDDDGRAIQIMRSWFTGQPGERVSCVGCHESAANAAGPRPSLAALLPALAPEPWHGPARAFGFAREVQPVLDRYCVGCHDGGPRAENQQPCPDLRGGREAARGFSASYAELHRYVRRPGPESDYHLPNPREYAADTSELVQMLAKGHHGVVLDAEAWDRLVTWIDLNVPDHGTWSEHRAIPHQGREKRAAARLKFANRREDPESYPGPPPATPAWQPPPAVPKPAPPPPAPPGWPFDASAAARLQAGCGLPAKLRLDLGEGVAMDLAALPAGAFLMGNPGGSPDEQPVHPARVERPFYLGITEITNRQFQRFDPSHDSGWLSTFNKDATGPGLPLQQANQPVVRVSWQQARDFCAWLAARSGRTVRLPDEIEWEWACRAGSAAGWPWDGESGFSGDANLADKRLLALCRRDSPPWLPHVAGVDDRATGTQRVAAYRANPWGLHDLHGNVAEWTDSVYRAYPGGVAAAGPAGRRVVRGGSFYDRPHRAAAGFRLAYPPERKVFNVGFRVLVEADPALGSSRTGP
jgi:formylglycine-generating enzyme required for sulfatase activity